ncbi:MAG: FtsQ-type POTRA domain-containing protein [Alphaproteobacteria bacterium]|nr:FtsQ-type POTRA domain-containing protein [Alphaproteobacteria bacterium]
MWELNKKNIIKLSSYSILVCAIALVILKGPKLVKNSNFYIDSIAKVQLFINSILYSSNYKIKNVEILGLNRTKEEEISKYFPLGNHIINLDLWRTREEIRRLPWVKEATIKRRLPDTLKIDIKERTPIAVYKKKNVYKPIDETGQLVEIEVHTVLGLPLIVGEEAIEKTPELLKILEQIPELYRRVRAAQRMGHRRWNIYLDGVHDDPNCVIIKLPENDPATAWNRLYKLDKEMRLLDRDIDTIDLRRTDELRIHTRNGKKIKSTTKNYKELSL